MTFAVYDVSGYDKTHVSFYPTYYGSVTDLRNQKARLCTTPPQDS